MSSDWQDGGTPYPYPFGLGEYGLPESRCARSGTEDLGTQAWARERRYLNMRRRFDALEPNPDAGGRASWPVVDSFGRPLATIERAIDSWVLSHPETEARLYADSSLDPGKLEVQGRGCMVDDDLEEGYALVAFHAADRSGLRPGESLVGYGLRAFIPRAALPKRNARGQRIRADVDDYDAGCGGSDLPPGAPAPLEDPGFASSERFLGEDGIARSYATYNAKAPFEGAIYFSVNTTGVHGGGIARGVARAGDLFEPVDEFDYPDPNHSPDLPPLAKWTYGRLAQTRMWGWVPVRAV
jgi:hypothetical protein